MPATAKAPLIPLTLSGESVSVFLHTLNRAAEVATPQQLATMRQEAAQGPWAPKQATEVVQYVMGWA